jgi:tRNA G18 (ribose-2'-O)-methylase SpoU
VPVVRIEAPDDPRIDDYRIVSEPVLARDRGLFVAEGRLVVSRLISARRFAVRSMLLTETAAESLRPLLSTLDPNVPIFIATAACLSGVAGVKIHRGCLALGVRPAAPDLDALLERARTVVVLEGVGNADNVGSVFRNAAAFGVDAVLVTPDCCDPLYRKSIRTSMGAALSVPFAELPKGLDAIRQLHAAGFSAVAFSSKARQRIQDYVGRTPPPRIALLFGAEGTGLSAPVREAADLQLRIPIQPSVDSLNVGVAVGIALSHLMAPG